MIYSEDQLKSSNFLEKIKVLALDIINEDSFREAYDLSKDLEQSIDKIKGFKDDYTNLYHEYKEVIVKMRWLGLGIMAEDRVVNMFQYHFADIFKIPDYEVWPKLKHVLINMPFFQDRDKFKANIRQALMNNAQKLTSKKILTDKKEASPTIGNWLLDYNKILGTGKVNALSRIEYLTNSLNIKNLDDKEKNKVKVLFDLYERLKLSSSTFEGLENEITIDDDGMMGTIKDGNFEPFRETEKQKLIWQMVANSGKAQNAENNELQADATIEELKQMAASYPAGSFERKAIEEEINRATRNS